MSKHTPGPWKVKLYGWQRENVSVFAPKFGRAPYGACVAYTPCSDGVGGSEGALANARLIAAAPDLLEALKECLPYVGQTLANTGSMDAYHTEAKACAAIAKAEGEKTCA